VNVEEAKQFLAAHSPLPRDEELSDSLIEQYDEVRRFLLENPDPTTTKLLLNSFGDGSGLGVYQLVVDNVAKLPTEAVETELRDALLSPHRGVRFWCSQIAAELPSPLYAGPLISNLHDADADIRASAADALGALTLPELDGVLSDAYEREPESHVKEAISRARAKLKGSA
jgi:hypothetical protein